MIALANDGNATPVEDRNGRSHRAGPTDAARTRSSSDSWRCRPTRQRRPVVPPGPPRPSCGRLGARVPTAPEPPAHQQPGRRSRPDRRLRSARAVVAPETARGRGRKTSGGRPVGRGCHHTHPARVHERQLAQARHHQPGAKLRAAQCALQPRRASEIQLTGNAHPRHTKTAVPQRTPSTWTKPNEGEPPQHLKKATTWTSRPPRFEKPGSQSMPPANYEVLTGHALRRPLTARHTRPQNGVDD